MGQIHLGFSSEKNQKGRKEASHFIDLLQDKLCGGNYNAFPKGVNVHLDLTSSYPKSGAWIEWDSNVAGAVEIANGCLEHVERLWADARNTPLILKRMKVQDEIQR